jgi:D-alanine transfer protein
VTPTEPRTRSHLLATSLATLLAAGGLAASLGYAHQLEQRYIHALAPELHSAKLLGVELQRLAFAQPDLLVLYGSSELAKEMPNNPREFFNDYPTDFRVFPVGKPGSTSLTTLQKLAAVGKDLHGRKLAFSISPGWFFTEVFDPKYYEGNFSEIQASEFIYSDFLSRSLRRDIARRMIEYPRTLDSRPFLEFVLDRLAGDTATDHFLYALAWPLGKLNSGIAQAQDHVEVAMHILDEDESLSDKPKRVSRRLAWNDVLKRALRFASKGAVQAKRNEVARRHLPRASRDRTFQQTMAKAKEWTDFELLLRVLRELGAQPLLLSMPIEDIRLEVYGISPETRTTYHQRLSGLASEYGFPLLDFHEYENDPSFMVDFLDHLSGSGWLYYNKALDDFFHGRAPKS